MSSRQRLFGWFYRLGFTPWDGHELSRALRDLIEGPDVPAPGTALDIGCGTGDSSIYLAKHGWRVTGVDYIAKPLAKARVKAAAEGVDVTFAEADATRLSTQGIGDGFGLIVDNGCLHGMSDADRDSYVREVTAIAAPDARLFLAAFLPGAALGVPGIAEDDVKRRFATGWSLLTSGSEPSMDSNGKDPARFYVFDRAV
jgi:SAM-dependent methyltransferase